MENKTFVVSKVSVEQMINSLSLIRESGAEFIDIVVSLDNTADTMTLHVREEYKETFPIDYNSLV